MQQLTPNLMVADVQATLAYYQQHFNASLLATVPETPPYNWAMVQMGAVHLMFQEEQNLKDEYPALRDQRPGGGFTLFVNVANVVALYEQLSGHVVVLKALHRTFYGALEFAIQDLNGYVLTLAETTT